MKKLHVDRLMKLANHLMTGKLKHKVFSFNNWNEAFENAKRDLLGNRCGYKGCAIGECPAVFPGQWVWDGEDRPNPKKGTPEEFFGITNMEFYGLFVPNEKRSWISSILAPEASRYEVGAGIVEFLAWKLKEENQNGTK